MCSRFTLHASWQRIVWAFRLLNVPLLEPRYNIAPLQSVAVVRCSTPYAPASNELSLIRWGLIPPHARNATADNSLAKIRDDWVLKEPFVRLAFQRRRCLIVADGFYKWMVGRNTDKAKGIKQPFYFRMRNSRPFAFAGLWGKWRSPEGEMVESCTLITTNANALVSLVHDRMPVILPAEKYDEWLDPQMQEVKVLNEFLQPYPAREMASTAVSAWVNDTMHEGRRCIKAKA